jgi:hypothetical protein
MNNLTRRRMLQALSATGLTRILPPTATASPMPSEPKGGVLMSPPLQFAQASGQPRPSPPTVLLTAAGKEYADGVHAFIADFYAHYEANIAFPIARVFNLFPFQVNDSATAQALVRRGGIEFANGQVSNHGEYVEATFSDANFGDITIPFDEEVKATANISDRRVEILFPLDKPAPIDFGTIDKKYQVARTQRLDRIVFTPTLVSYFLHSLTDKAARLRIDIDLTMGPRTKAETDSVQVASLAPVTLYAQLVTKGDSYGFQFAGFKCPCCGNGDNGGSKGDLGTQGNAYQYNAGCIRQFQNPTVGTAYNAYFPGRPFGIIDPDPDKRHWLLSKTVTLSVYTDICSQAGFNDYGVRGASFVVNWIRIRDNPDGTSYTVISNLIQNWL